MNKEAKMANPTFEQMQEFFRKAGTRFTSANFQGYLDNPDGLKSKWPSKFMVTIDYGLSLKDMIAAGKYGWVNWNITAENCPFKGTGKVETDIRLIHFNKWMTAQQVLSELEKLGLRSATLVELLALGAKYPELQYEYPIVAFGSVWRYGRGRGSVGVLACGVGGRRLGLDYLGGYGNGWDVCCRFAAVPK